MAQEAKKKRRGPGRPPKQPKSTVVVDFRRARKPGTVLTLATKGGDVNWGRMSPQDYEKAVTGAKENNGPGIVLYQPALIQLASDGSGKIATTGRAKNKPDGWSESQLGKWGCTTDENGESRGGDVITPVRCHHNSDITRRCKPECCVEIPGFGHVVLGIYGVNPQTTGSYAHIVETAKAQCFSPESLGGFQSQVEKLVGKINDAPYDEVLEHGGVITWAARNAITWGYFVKDGNRLTHAQVTDLVGAENVEGITFEALEEPIVGTPVAMSKLVTAVKTSMSKAVTKREGDDATAWDRFGYDDPEAARVALEQNITTLSRFNPKSMGCFGLRNVQTGIPLFICFSEDGSTRMVNMIIGCRLPLQHAETQWTANARLRAADEQSETKPKRPRRRKTQEKVSSLPEPAESDSVSTDWITGGEAPPVEDTGDQSVESPKLTAADIAAEESGPEVVADAEVTAATQQ